MIVAKATMPGDWIGTKRIEVEMTEWSGSCHQLKLSKRKTVRRTDLDARWKSTGSLDSTSKVVRLQVLPLTMVTSYHRTKIPSMKWLKILAA